MPAYPGFMGPSYQSQSYIADSERLINRFLEKNESPGAPAPYAMLACPGFELVTIAVQAPIRGMWSQSGRTFVAAGPVIKELVNGLFVDRMTVAVDSNPVTFMSDGDAGHQLGLTSGDHFYSFDMNTNTPTTVLTSGATMCAFLDGFGFILDAATSTLQVTDFENFTNVDAGNVQQRTAGSDPWKALYVVNRLVYLLGEHTSEVWYNAGTSPFPLAPIQEAFMQQGIAAPFSGCRMDTALCWLTSNEQGRGQIVAAEGYTPNRISTHAVEASIQTYDTISDAVSFSYQENGHTFAIMNFQSADRAWGFDKSTGLWHERLYWSTTRGEWLGYRPMFMCNDGTRNLVGDRLEGRIYRMSTELFTDIDSTMIRRLRQPPMLAFDQRRFVTHSIELVMDVGQGTQTGQGYNPVMMRQTSKDGGKTWGNEVWAETGKIGAFDTRVRWTQCGQARRRVDRFIDTDPVPSRIAGCLIDYTVGMS